MPSFASRTVLALLALLLAAAMPAAAQAPEGTVVLTIAGNVDKPNRGPTDKFRDGFFQHHSRSFQKAAEFDYATLAALPQVEVTAMVQDWPAAVKLSGPRLEDVLAAAGATGRTISLMALDGYAAEMTAEQQGTFDWVLALRADGKPLAIGGRGPLWLARDTGNDPPKDDAGWVWAIFLIEAR